jgi:hypothetical protein
LDLLCDETDDGECREKRNSEGDNVPEFIFCKFETFLNIGFSGMFFWLSRFTQDRYGKNQANANISDTKNTTETKKYHKDSEDNTDTARIIESGIHESDHDKKYKKYRDRSKEVEHRPESDT